MYIVYGTSDTFIETISLPAMFVSVIQDLYYSLQSSVMSYNKQSCKQNGL